MPKLEKLLHRYNLTSFPVVKIDSVIDYEQPGKYIVQSTRYDNAYPTPVLTAGQTFILGYTDDKSGIYAASKDNPVIIFDDFTGAFKWVDFPFKVKSSAVKLLTAKGNAISLRYFFHLMGHINFTSDEHKRLWIGTYSSFSIPLPPLEVQQEIVRILDRFTQLTAELTAELTARKQQYIYYRNCLLSHQKQSTWMTLGDIGKVAMCKRIMKAETSPSGDVPFYKIGTFGKEPDAYITKEKYEEYRSKYSFPKKGDILISAAGTIGRTVIYDGQPAYYQDSNIVWVENDESIVLNRYLYYYYQLQPWAVSTGGTIARLYNDNISKAKISVPPLPEQRRIVAILDRFDALCNDLTSGLPAEIAARQKQYEYYRDKLLTFKEKVPHESI